MQLENKCLYLLQQNEPGDCFVNFVLIYIGSIDIGSYILLRSSAYFTCVFFLFFFTPKFYQLNPKKTFVVNIQRIKLKKCVVISVNKFITCFYRRG